MDNTLLHFFNQTLANPVLDVLMIFITLIGNPTYHLIAIPILWLVIKPFRKLGAAIWLTLLVTLGITLLFQFAVLRPRPDPALIRLIWPQPNFPSYPSGHASCAFALAVCLGLRLRTRRVWAIGLAWAVLVALSRVYLGHHYLSDVLGGAVLGAGIGASLFGLLRDQVRGTGDQNRKSATHLSSRIHWLFFAQLALALIATNIAYLGILPMRYLSWPYSDKVLHVVLMGGLSFWLNLGLRGRTLRIGWWLLPVAIAIPFAVAFAEECLQSLSPLRTFDLLDLACDLLGMWLAWWLSNKLLQRQPATSAASALS